MNSPPASTWTNPRRPGSTTPFASWWRELQSALDADGDGRISAGEYAAAVPSLAGPALIRVAEVLFDVTDKDGSGTIDADEYRTLFRTAFHRDLTVTAGTYGRSAFVGDFLSAMSGRRTNTPYDPLLADARRTRAWCGAWRLLRASCGSRMPDQDI